MRETLQLRPYQEQGRHFLATTRHAILGDTMGLGKSPQYIMASLPLVEAGGLVLVMAPEATIPGQKAEIEKWSGHEATVIKRRSKRASWPKSGYVLLGYTSAAAQLGNVLAGPRLSCLVLDEFHRCKNPRAAVTKAVLGQWRRIDGRWQQVPSMAGHTERLWALSGTPVPNRPIELRPLLHLGLGLSWATSQAYGDRYCRRNNSFAPRGYDYQGARNLRELNRRLRDEGVLLRRTAADVPEELPALTVVPVPLNGTASVRAEKAALEVAGLTAESVASAVTDITKVPFEQMSEYRAALGAQKASLTAQWVTSWLTDNDGEALVVFVWHRETAEAIRDMLSDAGVDCLMAHGGHSAADRQAMVDRFAAGEGEVFIGTIAACGTGLNGLHLRTTKCAFGEFAWTPGELDQAIGRVRRVKSVSDLTIAYLLFIDGSLEGHMLLTIAGKLDVQSTILADTGTVEASPQVVPQVVPQAPVEELPDPAELSWSWSYHRASEQWAARVGHGAQTEQAPHPWTGSTVDVKARGGKVKRVILVKCLSSGRDWSLWQQTEDTVSYALKTLRKRAQKREAPVVDLDGAPVGLLQWAIDAVRTLAMLDADRAQKRNDVGYNKADGKLGHMLACLPDDAWDGITLGLALQMLEKYHGQVGVFPVPEMAEPF